MLRYTGPWGANHVKVDCIYMNRSPLLPLVKRESNLRPEQGVRVFSDAELAGGKVKAYFDRVKVRDLYDLSSLASFCNKLVVQGSPEAETWHKTLLYYASLSASFPFGFEGREMRFADRRKEVEDQLYPMLRTGEESPTLEELMENARAFVASWVLPQTDEERAYLDRFAAADYQPTLLFADTAMARAAAQSPEALWKLHNLEQMPR